MHSTFCAVLSAVALTFILALDVNAQSIPPEPEPVDFLSLHEQAQKHLLEGDRLLVESGRLRDEAERLSINIEKQESEARRLAFEQKRLLAEVSRLDNLWLVAHEANPELYPDFPGRDRSQRIMRADVDRMAKDERKILAGIEVMELDVRQLLEDADKLSEEALRLWRLAARDDADAQYELWKRLGGGNVG